MTVHVISVGLSIVESLASPRECEALDGTPDLAQVIQRASPDQFLAGQGITGPGGKQASAWLASALTPAGQPGRDEQRAGELARLCAQVQPGRWPSGLSAELDTFGRASGGGAHLSRDDVAVLVSSDTASGLGAAVWNAAALVAGDPVDLGRVRYLATPDQSPAGVRGRAVLVRVEGLDASSDDGFRTAMRGLGLLGRNLLDTGGVGPGEPFRFYLSGGFKAAIPYLIGLAEGLRSLDPGRDVCAYVLHDTTRSAPIRLPLRRLLPEVIRAHLAGFDADGARSDKPSGTAALLEGYAYERDGRRWRLTAFGEGLRALFGARPGRTAPVSRRRGPDRDGLAELRARLSGGVGPAAARDRPGDWRTDDETALGGWPSDDELGILGELRDLSWNTRWREASGAGVAGRLVAELRSNRSRLIAVLLSPAAVLDGLVERSGQDPVRAWAGLCWTADAAWAVTHGALDAPGYSPGDRDLLAPLAARLRFLALSEPMRWRAEPGRAWWAAAPADREFDGDELVRRILGDSPWHVLVGQCREGRRAWLACLDAYQSHPLLARAAPREIEDELAAVVFRHPRSRGERPPAAGEPARAGVKLRRLDSAPLVLSDRPLSEVVPLSAEDAVIVSDATERHLLPRFELGGVAALAAYSPARRGRVARVGLAGVVIAAAAAAVVYAALLQFRLAAWLAVIPYVLIAAGVVAFGPRWAAPWLLRMPAASAIGVFALVSVLPGGWLAGPPGGWAACGVLGGAAVGYLVVEGRNHGVAAPQALTRSAAVAAVGAVHALLVSLLGLVIVAPAFVGKGRLLAMLWSRPGGFGRGGLVLLLATAWCLAVGVFSQILWDDRPITAPLAHLQWRSGETSQ